MRSGADVGLERLAHALYSSSSKSCSVSMKSELCVGCLGSSTMNLSNHALKSSFWSTKCWHKIGGTILRHCLKCLSMVLHQDCSGGGPSSNPEIEMITIIPPTPNFRYE